MEGCSFHCRGGVPSCAPSLLRNTNCYEKHNRIVCQTSCANMRRMCRSRGEYVRYSEPVPLELLDKYNDSKGFVQYRENVSTQDVDAPCFYLTDEEPEDVLFFEGGHHRDAIAFGEEVVLYLADITAKRSMLARNDRRHGVLCLPRAKDYAGTSCAVDANRWVIVPLADAVEAIEAAGENVLREGDVFCLKAIPEHTVPRSNAYLCWNGAEKFFYMGARGDAARLCVPEKSCNACTFDPITLDDAFDDDRMVRADHDDDDEGVDGGRRRTRRVRFASSSQNNARHAYTENGDGGHDRNKMVRPLLLASAAALTLFLLSKEHGKRSENK